MRAMVLERSSRITANAKPLLFRNVPRPDPARGEVPVEVSVCGVCHIRPTSGYTRLPNPGFLSELLQ